MKTRITPLAALMRSRITRWGILSLLAIATLTILTLASAQPAAAQSGTDRLYSGERLYRGQYLSSRNGMYELRMQDDGNLVIYRITSTSVVPTWSTRTDFSPREGQYKWLGNQGDGNLVIYTETQPYRALWASGTAGQGASTLIMQNDGNLVLYKTGNVPIWASHTNSSASPGSCNPVKPLSGAYYSVPTPNAPILDGQRPDAWMHALGRVSSWSIPCSSWIQTIIERKSCGTWGCSWVWRVQSAKVPVNQVGWTFVEAHSVCKEGRHTYRTFVRVWSPSISDTGSSTWKEGRSSAVTFDCTGIGT